MISTLLIDNYDSFTQNLFHLLAKVNGRPPVLVPNDWDRWAPSVLDDVDNVVLSPGPGTPANPTDIGICAEVIATSRIPVLGICLGHQSIALAAGARVGHAPDPRHGRVSAISHAGEGLFEGLPSPFDAVRYHSMAVTEVASPLAVTARSEDGVVQGIAHRERPLWGVQFHPESILTDHGETLLANFARLTREHQSRAPVRAVSGGDPQSGPDRSQAAEPAPDPASEPESEELPHLPLLTRTVPFTGDPAALFDTLHGDDDCAVWLDGNLPGDDRGRFSIMGAPTGPLGRIAEADVTAGTVTLTGPGAQVGTVDSGFFDWLAAELRRHRVPSAATAHLPFDFGLGWVGYLGYELKTECGSSAAHQAPTPDATLVFLDRAIILDSLEGTAHLLALDPATHPGEADAWTETTSAVVARADALPPEQRQRREHASQEPPHTWPALHGEAPQTATASHAADPHAAASGLTALLPREEYIERVREAQRLIRDGETYEVCLTTRIEGPVDALASAGEPRAPRRPTRVDDPLWDAYLRLRQDNPAPFGAYLRLPGATVLSTSPERFLRIDSTGRVESSPIKGTRPRGRNAAEDAALIDDLRTSEKDRSENLMIVDLVRHDLGRTARTGSVQVETLFGVESYASVHQLVSTVTAQLADDASPVECVRAAFPPGSMTGAPKLRTMEILNGLESGPRGVYSGAVGWFSLTGSLDLSVVIRTLVASQGRFSYGVGGAVVALSGAVEEYEETVVKAGPLLRLLEQRGHSSAEVLRNR
ncbi:aminodeoxychorismate synthase component I [Brevibacterium yomogidense]|uniref:aminodeoxychorismate synthase component I n=1 Tax=Brevibacterium yomogidense TaxID=946573 RepID=UPI0018DF7CC6|nr:aminodeoxychorismate synthase component I [Brevibacterium yomogidense]